MSNIYMSKTPNPGLHKLYLRTAEQLLNKEFDRIIECWHMVGGRRRDVLEDRIEETVELFVMRTSDLFTDIEQSQLVRNAKTRMYRSL